MLAVLACRGEAPAPPATPAAHPAVPISLLEFRTASREAAADAGLDERQIRALPGLSRLRRLGASLVRGTHIAYEEDDFAPDDVFRREGWMVLLGEHRGRVIGLTTRCTVDVHQPGYQYLDPREPGEPELVAGLLALPPPGAPPDNARRDGYLIEHETDWSHALLRRPYGRFLDEWLAGAGLDAARWPALLERGARVRVHAIGAHDLALVSFEPAPRLGVDGEGAAGGVRVTAVWPGSVAARAACATGDLIVSLDGAALPTPAELQSACDALGWDRSATLRWQRAGPDGAVAMEAAVSFRRDGDFLADGTCGTLGVEAPMEAVATLLESLTTVGDLLQTELTAQCARCRERVQRAEVRGAPTLAEALGRLVPIAGGLLSIDADRAVDLAGRATGVGAVVEAVQEWRRLLAGVDDLERFLSSFPVGDPIALDPASVEVLGADRLRARDLAGGSRELRLAYCAAAPGGARELARVCDMARAEQRLLVAVPDGRDLAGVTHVHLLVVKPDEWPPRDWRAKAALATEGYVNLVLIRAGACHADDHGVSDGRATRLVLEAFRRLDRLDR